MAADEFTRQDLQFAKQRIKALLSDRRKVFVAQGVSPVISALAGLADKLALARDNNGEAKPGWLYTFLTTSVLSGASSELVNYYVMREQVAVEMSLQSKVHQEFDNFPIAERKRRKPEEITVDDSTMRIAANGYLGSKGNLIGQSISAAVMLGTTLVSGGLANLPVMGAVIGLSGAYSYLINRKMNADKIAQKNNIRKTQVKLVEHSRHMYSNSLEREINDPEKKSYRILEQKQEAFLGSFKSFTNMLSKYALVGTAVKAAIVGGVTAATWATNPANVLVTAAAALGCYSSVTGCVNSWFSLKEHVGNFAHAYKSFRSKMTNVSFGKEKIRARADTIQLDRIGVKHREAEDITAYKKDWLFRSNEDLRIGRGITLLSGASGAGKSSLLNLLMHSDDVAEGAIRIGTTDEKGHFKGTDYKKLAFGEPARNISMSLQGGKLSQMTVEEYIRLANPQASEELVNRVKDLVGIKEDKDNPSCISPSLMIDSGGNNVSGGQINRLNLAQALIKDAPIMILDEPTAGVDATMSENIINYINGLKNDKTIVYITHNVDEVKKLEASQALDIGKDNGAETATIVRYDLSENAEKKSYVEFFANRNVGRSPSRSSAEHLDVTAELARVKEKLYGRKPDARTAAETNAAAIEKTTADKPRSAIPPRQGYSY